LSHASAESIVCPKLADQCQLSDSTNRSLTDDLFFRSNERV
jgi:hypothetical protein